MRLNNYSLLQDVYNLGLSGPLFNDVKLLMCLGERLKNMEQSLIFLKKCHSKRIFPVFIMNSFKYTDSVFPDRLSFHGQELVFKLRYMCLNNNINFKYQYISQLKSDVNHLKSKLQTVLPIFVYQRVMNMFNDNTNHTKLVAKRRLSQKFNWLVYKYYTHEWNNWRRYSPNRRYIITDNPMDPQFRLPSTGNTVIRTTCR